MRALLLVFLSFFCANTLLAQQVWIDQGATWHYNFYLGVQGFVKHAYTSNTTIEGQDCQVIQSSRYRFFQYNGSYNLLSIENEGPNYTYASNDTVYWWVDDQFYVLYDFSAQPGDQWVIGPAVGPGCHEGKVQVDSIGTATINGQNLRWVALHALDSSSYYYKGIAFERFGMVCNSSPHSLFPVTTACVDSIIIDHYIHTYACYEDDNFDVYNTSGQACDYWLSVSTPELNYSNTALQVYSDPVNRNLLMRSENMSGIVLVRIYDMAGREILKTEAVVQPNEWSTLPGSGLSSGLYLLQAEQKGSQVLSQKIRIF